MPPGLRNPHLAPLDSSCSSGDLSLLLKLYAHNVWLCRNSKSVSDFILSRFHPLGTPSTGSTAMDLTKCGSKALGKKTKKKHLHLYQGIQMFSPSTFHNQPTVRSIYIASHSLRQHSSPRDEVQCLRGLRRPHTVPSCFIKGLACL